jgi:hypothetical protein
MLSGRSMFALVALAAAVGLDRRNATAAFIAWLFLTSCLAQELVFVFPLVRPALEPDTVPPVSRLVSSGAYIAGMPNYHWHTTGRYYFARMSTVALAVVRAIYAMCRMWTAGRPNASRRLA